MSDLLAIIAAFTRELTAARGEAFVHQLLAFLAEHTGAEQVLVGEPHRKRSECLRLRYNLCHGQLQPTCDLTLTDTPLASALMLPAGQLQTTEGQLPCSDSESPACSDSLLLATPLHLTDAPPGLLAMSFAQPLSDALRNALDSLIPLLSGRLTAELDQLRSARQLEDEKQQTGLLLDSLPNAVVVKDGDNNWISINQAASQLWDIPRQDFNHMPEAMVATHYPHTARLLEQCSFSDEIAWRNRNISASTEYHRSSERLHTFEVLKQPVYTPGGKRHRLLVVCNDISTELDLKNELRLSASVFESSVQGIVICDARGRIERMNAAANRMLGVDAGTLHKRSSVALLSRTQCQDALNQVAPALRSEGSWQGELWMHHSDGHDFPVWMGISAVRDSQGNVHHFIGQFHDTTDEKTTEDYIYRLSHFDTLTGLPNRVSLLEHLATLMEAEQPFAVLHLDINRLKLVNDSLGHHIGDQLLKQVSAMLSDTARHANYIAHLTGDEFMIVVTPNEIYGNGLNGIVQETLTRVLDRFYAPFNIGPHSINTSASIGIAQFPANGRQPERLLRAADTAVSHAKENNQRFTYYDASMNVQLLHRLRLEHQLSGALERNELQLYYQPQYDTVEKRVTGCEALLRWHSPEMGLVSPGEFIPVAEETGLIVPIGNWVLRQACEDMVRLRRSGFQLGHMAVNLSAAQFLSSGLVPEVARILLNSGLPPAFLQLEITESIIIDDLRNTLEVLRELRDQGVTVALDDFGTGYSSLSYLKQLPIDKLKIDRSFIEHIQEDLSDAAIAEAIITMAEALKLEVIAEGVESSSQIDCLRQIGCSEIQGFHFAQPMPMNELIAFLNSQGNNRYQRIPMMSV